MILSKKLCAGIFSIVLALGLVSGFAQGADSETDPNFNRARERAAMMAHLENPPVQALSIVNIPRDPEAASFLNFFKTTLWPDFEKMGLYVFRRELLHTAFDRALYNDAAEEDQWRKMELEASQIIDALDTNPKRQENIRIWAKQAKALLAKGIKGELIDLALRMKGDLDASSFTEKELPLLNRQSEIELTIAKIANTSPLVPGLEANEKAVNDTIEAYFAKKLAIKKPGKNLNPYNQPPALPTVKI
jgi:hypothetical protein